jgi:hypothetical protein
MPPEKNIHTSPSRHPQAFSAVVLLLFFYCSFRKAKEQQLIG